MHRAQRFGCVRLDEQLAQVRPQPAVLRHGVVESTASIVEPALGFHGQFHSLAGHKDKQAKHDLWISRSRRLLNVNPAIDHGEFVTHTA